MEIYTFYHNQDIINPKIFMENNDIEESDFYIGDIYNLVDYINNIPLCNSVLIFNNFKGNQIKFIISAISRYKVINTIEDYNTITVSDKKVKIRGKIYDKMD